MRSSSTGSSNELKAVSETDGGLASIDSVVLNDAWADETGDWTVYTRDDDSTLSLSLQNIQVSL